MKKKQEDFKSTNIQFDHEEFLSQQLIIESTSSISQIIDSIIQNGASILYEKYLNQKSSPFGQQYILTTIQMLLFPYIFQHDQEINKQDQISLLEPIITSIDNWSSQRIYQKKYSIKFQPISLIKNNAKLFKQEYSPIQIREKTCSLFLTESITDNKQINKNDKVKVFQRTHFKIKISSPQKYNDMNTSKHANNLLYQSNKKEKIIQNKSQIQNLQQQNQNNTKTINQSIFPNIHRSKSPGLKSNQLNQTQRSKSK